MQSVYSAQTTETFPALKNVLYTIFAANRIS